jgi:hypothetical protein
MAKLRVFLYEDMAEEGKAVLRKRRKSFSQKNSMSPTSPKG